MERAEVSHRERVASRKIGNPPGFEWFRWEAIGDAVLMTGCVVTRMYTSGKRKGLPAFDGPPVKVVVTDLEVEAESQRYEAETGNCAECLGTGQVWAGWTRDDGHRYKPCPKCAREQAGRIG